MNTSPVNKCRLALLVFFAFFISTNAVAQISVEWAETGHLYGSTNLLKWSEVAGATHYRVKVGSTPGSDDIVSKIVIAPSLTAVIRDLPTDGELLYITLRARINESWSTQFIAKFPAALSPVLEMPGADLMSLSHRFAWRPQNKFLTKYRIIAHDGPILATANRYGYQTIVDPDDDLSSWSGSNYGTITGLPLNGSDVWVTLKWQALGRWWTETPVRYVAASGSMITSPADGSTLGGASAVFNWVGSVPQADRFQFKVGSSVYFDNTSYSFHHALTTVGMPLDGTSVPVELKYHDADDNRWYTAATANYTAATATAGIWGDCTAVDAGVRARVFPASISRDWPFAIDSTRGLIRLSSTKVAEVLRDGCASDNNYVSTDFMEIYVDSDEKGIYLWLAAGSGAAQVEFTSTDYFSAGPMYKVIAFHDDAAVANPLFIRFPNPGSYYRLTIEPIDPAKPVRLSELRFARTNDVVSTFRKLRFRDPVGHGYFASTSSDLRGRVTAEIDRDFGPIYIAAEGRGPSPTSCGYYSWIDGTWIGNQGISLFGHTVWINWNLVSNAEVSAMLEQSVQAGIENQHWYYACTPASAALINQNWLQKAQQALNNTYSGPTLMQ